MGKLPTVAMNSRNLFLKEHVLILANSIFTTVR